MYTFYNINISRLSLEYFFCMEHQMHKIINYIHLDWSLLIFLLSIGVFLKQLLTNRKNGRLFQLFSDISYKG